MGHERDISLATILEDARARFNNTPKALDGLSLHSVWQQTHNHNELRAHYYPVFDQPPEGRQSVSVYKVDIGTGVDNHVVLPKIGPRGTPFWAQGVNVEAWMVFEIKGSFFVREADGIPIGRDQQPAVGIGQQERFSQVLIAIPQSGLEYNDKPTKLNYHPGTQRYESVECWTTTYTLKFNGGQVTPTNVDNQPSSCKPPYIQTKMHRFRLEFSGRPESINTVLGQTNISAAQHRDCLSIKLNDNINPQPPSRADQRHVKTWRKSVSNALAEEMRLWQRIRADLECGTFMVKTWEACDRRRGEEQF